MMPFQHTVSSVEELRTHYREPSKFVLAKKQATLDDPTRRFIEASPFVLLGTSSPGGTVEVSPRGGPPGFVTVLDETRIAIPDLNGNNLVDSMTNIVSNPYVGLLFVHPGKDETLRVNGRAWITLDPEILNSFTGELRPPKAAIGIEITDLFIHCAKAFRRGEVWQPESWKALDPVDAIDMLKCHLSIDAPKEVLLKDFAQGYADDLAQD
jgi:uncharacterized protein